MKLSRGTDSTAERVLVVADWTADAEAVLAVCVQHRELSGGALRLLVPARLHGLDWAGDPAASVPCAQRQLTTIGRLADAVGFAFEGAAVGDPDPLAAICDALHAWPAGEVLLCTRRRGAAVSHPLDLARRTRRLTGLPVSRIQVRPSATPKPSTGWLRWRSGHCALDRPRTA
jgi:hypothetical protein